MEALRRHRFECYHGALVICGLGIAAGPLRTLLVAPGTTGSALFEVLGLVAGVGFVAWGIWGWTFRDPEAWEADVEEHGIPAWTMIGLAALSVGMAVYAILSAA